MDPEKLREEIKHHSHPNPQVLFAWQAPLRAYKKKSAGVLRFYIAVSILLSLLAFFFGELILILPIWATLFLVYVLTITPPGQVDNRVTKFGIEAAGNTYRWEALSHFYFVRKFDYHVLVVVSAAPYYSHIYLVVEGSDTKSRLIKLLSEYIIFQEKPHKTFTDKLAEALTKLMPEDNDEAVSQAPTPSPTPSI